MGLNPPWSSYSRFNAWWNGRRDGKLGIPPLDQTHHTAYELELQKLAEENIRRVAQEWEAMDVKLKSEYCKARFQHDAALMGGKAAQDEHGGSSGEEDAAQRLMHEMYGKEHLSPAAYRILMTVLAIVELPINSIVFELFGKGALLTYLTASIIAIGLPAGAHFLGILLKKEPLKEGFLHTQAFLLYLLIAAPFGLLAAISYVREKFFEATGAHRVLGVEMDPILVMITFFALNLFIYLIATVLSYFHHDLEIRQARKELDYYQRHAREDRQEIVRFEALVETTQRRYQDARNRRQNQWEEKRHKALEIQDISERLIEHYRKHNQRARKDPQQPKSFETLPVIHLPKALQELEWECSELRASDSIGAAR